MNYNLITAVIAIAAILAPVLVSIIDNYYSLERFDKEVNRERKYQKQEKINRMIDNYLISAARLTACDLIDMESLESYKESYFVLAPHMNEKIRKQMKEIDAHIEGLGSPSFINDYLEEVVSLLNEDKTNKR